MKKILILIAVILAAGAGCAGMTGSSASSASISSLSASSTAPAAAPHAYATDLANTVILAMRRGTEDDELLRQIGIVAERHGLRDWESVADTFAAIGDGLRQAGVSGDKAGAVANLVSGSDDMRRQLVLQAYGS